ncbi:hypothetical protein StoSoilA2_38750 [Arthrobacter sp. StoSoilA2]|nr:hypothetical protein StoSoilA2_38750 [Arthrobacter sp. StoSoilA2]
MRTAAVSSPQASLQRARNRIWGGGVEGTAERAPPHIRWSDKVRLRRNRDDDLGRTQDPLT